MIQDYKIDLKNIVGGKWDTDKVSFHRINMIEGNGEFCHSLFYQIKKRRKFFEGINLNLRVFKDGRGTVDRLGTCWPSRNQINLYCRSVKVFLHEICHFVYNDGHGQGFLNYLDGMIDLCGELIPVTHEEKVRMSVQIIKRKIDRYIHFDEDQEILNLIEISAKVNGLDADEILDLYYE